MTDPYRTAAEVEEEAACTKREDKKRLDIPYEKIATGVSYITLGFTLIVACMFLIELINQLNITDFLMH